MRWVLLFSLLYKWDNWGVQKLNNLPNPRGFQSSQQWPASGLCNSVAEAPLSPWLRNRVNSHPRPSLTIPWLEETSEEDLSLPLREWEACLVNREKSILEKRLLWKRKRKGGRKEYHKGDQTMASTHSCFTKVQGAPFPLTRVLCCLICSPEWLRAWKRNKEQLQVAGDQDRLLWPSQLFQLCQEPFSQHSNYHLPLFFFFTNVSSEWILK